MPQLRISTVGEAADLAWGLAFLGTGGGGGRVQDALDMLVTAMEKGATAAFVETSELPGNAWTAAVASVGGREPDLGPRPEELAQYGLVQERFSYIDRMVRALEALQDHAGTRLGAVVSFELGTSTVAALVAASRLGLPCVNGDYAGRAVPELSQTKAEIFGLRVHPAVLADRWGSVVILKEAPSAAMVDRVGRMLSVAAYGGGVGLAGYLYQLHEAARALVPNSIGRALAIGRAIRMGAKEGNLVDAVTAATGGRLLFSGAALETEWHLADAYIYRLFDYHLRGTAEDKGHTGRVWVKNEHHVVWRDEDVLATSPDLIALLDATTGIPLSTRGDVVPGRSVLVFAMPVLDSAWRTEQGTQLLGPRHFGFDFDYVPLEDRPVRR